MIAKKYFLLSLGVFVAAALSAQTTETVLNDTFGSGTTGAFTAAGPGIGTQGPPASATWFADSTNVPLISYTNGTPGSLAITGLTTTAASITSYFASPGAFATLAGDGDSLSLAVTFTVTAPASKGTGFKIGLINSSSTAGTPEQLTANTSITLSTGVGNPTLWTGYYAAANLGTTSSGNTATTLFSRPAGAANTHFADVTTGFTAIGATSAGLSPINSTDTFTATLTVTNNSGTITAAYKIVDVTTSGTPFFVNSQTQTTGTVTTQFDGISIGWSAAQVGSMTIKGVNVTYTAPSAAAAPTFSPVAGTYTVAQSVTINDGGTDSSDSFAYTTDGTTPTEIGGTVTHGTLYSGSVSLGATATLNAIAFKSGFTDSTVTSGVYTINIPQAAAPTFSPVAGTYTVAQSVTISSTTGGATIRYTTDGSTPTETVGTIYSGPVSISATTTLNAIAFEAGFTDSTVTSGIYTINIAGVTSAPTFSPVAGTYTAAQSVTITTITGGASIAYTTDGSIPTESGGSVTHGTLYSGSVSIGATATLKAIAFKVGSTDSTVTSGIYTITLPATAPTFSPVAGTYTAAQSVTISSTTGGASIAYTTDGSTPTESGGSVTHGTLYSAPVSIGTNTTLSAIAFEAGFTDSTVTSGIYTIVLPAATPTFSPAAGTYTSVQLVAISSTTAGTSISYTTDGSTPTETHGTVIASGASASIGATATLQAIAFETGFSDSTVASAAYTITLPTTVTTTLLDDTFGSGSGSIAAGAGVQALPNSAEWVEAASGGEVETYTSGSPGSLTLVNNASAGALAYFTPAGSPQQLNVGDTLTVTFNFTVTTAGGTNGLRVAVLNSGGAANRNTGTTAALSSGLYTPYQGFAAFFNPNAGQGAPSLLARAAGSGSTLINTTGTIYTTFAPAGPTPTPGLTSGTPYQGVLTLSPSSATAMNVSFEILSGGVPVSGYSLSGSSSPTIASIATAFDTFVIGASSAATTSFSLSTVDVVFTTPLTTVAAPVFSPAAGSFASAQAVSITDSTAGSAIRFTTDGSTPSETVGTLYSGPVSVITSTTLSAIGFKAGLSDSPVSTAAYSIAAISAPTFSPPAGTYTSAQSVAIAATSGASIRYTTDGSTPTETVGTLYSGPVSITGSAGANVQRTLKAIAFEAGFTDSPVSTGVYTIQGGVATVVPSSSASGGGGALDEWFLAVLAVLGVLRWRRTRR